MNSQGHSLKVIIMRVIKIYYHFIKNSYQIIHELVEIPKIDIQNRIDFVESYITKYNLF